MNKLKGKTALVTGGSRGIGRAISRRLAQDGAHVIIHYGKNKKEALATAEEIKNAGGSAIPVAADFKNSSGVEELILGLKALTVNHLDILVNNAGIGLIEEFETTTEAQLDELFMINVKAPFLASQKLLPMIKEQGRIINVTSVVTRMAMPSVAAYSMTKGALDVLTLILAKKLGPRGITVNSVAPGVINTDLNADALGHADSRRFMESLSTFNRVGESQDIADVVSFLASDEARWISGQRIEASGGSFLGPG